MTDTTPLSPAAQAVLDAYRSTHLSINNLAAALRAAADQVVPEEQSPPRRGMRPGGIGALTPEEGAEDQRAATRRRLRAIAAELEGPTDEELWVLYDEMGGAPEDAAWVCKYARAVLARWGQPS